MKKTIIGTIYAVLLVAAAVWFIWTWGFCRFYVEPDEMAIITSKGGTPLPPGQILAKEGQKGIREDVLGEGRHFLDPIMYSREIRPVQVIPAGQVGIVIAKVGDDLPPGEFLAGPNQKGIRREVLGPGKYRLNPYGYQVDVVDAVSVPIGYAGVITSLSGDQAPNGEFAARNQKGVWENILQPGLYYVNPNAFKVDVLEVGVNQVSLLGRSGGTVITKGQLQSQNVAMEQLESKVIDERKQKRLDYLSESVQSMRAKKENEPGGGMAQQAAVDMNQVRQQYMKGDSISTLGLAEFLEFPSRDGFQISLDMTVEIELAPARIAWIFSHYGDLPALVDKIIVPQITSIARNKGSEYGAKDFIAGEGREKFQNELTKTLAATLEEKKIIVHNALIRHVEVPPDILDPIQQASIAIEQDLTNKQRQNTAKKQAELNTEQSLIEQRRLQVAQETQKMKAEIRADEELQVAQTKAEATKSVAEISKETAGIAANTVRVLAEAEATALKMVEGEKASGQQLKAKAFRDPVAYGLWEFAERLPDDMKINIIHAGSGTLWTDLEKATTGELGGAVLLNKQPKKE